jgi:hypothetical protein
MNAIISLGVQESVYSNSDEHMPYSGDLYFGEKFTFMNVYGTVETIAQRYQG